MCGHAASAALPPPLHAARAHTWRVTNRYYKASLQLLTLEDDAASAAAITALAQQSQALVLLFDLAEAASWRALLQRWEGMVVSGAVG